MKHLKPDILHHLLSCPGRSKKAMPLFFIPHSSFFIFLLFLLFLSSCSIMDEGPGTGCPTCNTAQIAFTLKVEGTSAATKTTWGEELETDEPGQGYENYIDPTSLQVVIYGSDNSTPYVLQSLYREEYDDTKGEYTFVGEIDLEDDDATGLTSGTEYKIMVFANCPTISSTTDLDNLTYHYGRNNDGEHTVAIPMWGVATATLALTPGERQTLTEPIYLLRAVAKVEVKLAEDEATQAYEITCVTLSRSNTQGYCLPKDYKRVDNTKELEREEGNITTFHPHPNSEIEENVAFKNTNGKYILYLPEYDNTGEAATIATLSVTLKEKTAGTDEEGMSYSVEFKNYDDDGQAINGTTFDLVRNHLYRYTLKMTEVGLRFRVVIEDLKDGGDYYYEY